MDKLLRSIIKISQASITFTAFDDLFQLWLARVQEAGSYEVVGVFIPNLGATHNNYYCRRCHHSLACSRGKMGLSEAALSLKGATAWETRPLWQMSTRCKSSWKSHLAAKMATAKVYVGYAYLLRRVSIYLQPRSSSLPHPREGSMRIWRIA